MPSDGFDYVRGDPKRFTRSDIEDAVTREFCAECGTHIATRRPDLPAVILKVGTLDDPGQYRGPDMAVFTVDKQAFHQIPEGLPTFERMPKRWDAFPLRIARSREIQLAGNCATIQAKATFVRGPCRQRVFDEHDSGNAGGFRRAFPG